MQHFFGDAWLKRHFIFAKASGYLWLGDGVTAIERRTWRTINLAEMLLNLQHIEGFPACIEQMAQGEIEATYAELETAKELYWRDIRFKFVRRTGVKGNDYDLEITFADGRVACADTKCKRETTPFTTNSLLNSLQEARPQLPRDNPGIVIVRVPEHWMEELHSRTSMIETTNKFLNDTGRVVSVVLYSPLFIYDSAINKVLNICRFMEVMNAHHRHAGGTDWTLFVISDRLMDYQPTPQHWISLDEFEEGTP
jgi:hypothetical protein